MVHVWSLVLSFGQINPNLACLQPPWLYALHRLPLAFRKSLNLSSGLPPFELSPLPVASALPPSALPFVLLSLIASGFEVLFEMAPTPSNA